MSLDEARKQIDAVDQQLIKLLNERAELVHIVGTIKKQEGLDVYVPGREEQLLRKLADLNTAQKGRLTEKAIRSIYREIMSAALALETSMKIAYLGPAGSWTHQVAINKFGNSVEYVADASTEGVFDRVASRVVDYGVLPIEHSTEGAVHHTLDRLVDSDLQIYAEILWRAETVVMAQGSGDEIEAIHGHPQVLAQCRPWLSERFPGAQLTDCASSSAAAALAANSPRHAALGTPLSAELHSLKVIATSPSRHTTQARFIVLGARSGSPSGQDNSMLMVHARDRVGALLEILQIFATHGVNVRQIENRPVPGDAAGTQARFFLEISGHLQDAPIGAAISQLESLGTTVKPLGSYPAPSWIEER
jgi:chorismate mutase/prephenate dehydratase